MSETCPRCKRVRPPFAVHDDDEFLGFTACYGPTTHSCQIVTAARHDGMREGFAIAEAHASAGTTYIGNGDYVSDIDWTDARAEPERRLSGKERGDD